MPLSSSVWDSVARERYPYFPAGRRAHMRVLVHGGAGSAPDEPAARQAVLDAASRAGADARTPEAAVVATVRHLESDPRFNAGVGSAVQSDGVARTDAGLMTGDGASGAACAMAGVEHAVEVARLVRADTPHVLLAGERAVALADDAGVATDRDLWTDATRARWQAADPPETAGPREQLAWVREQFGDDISARDHDTVGAVATDGDQLAAATSTGGRWFALAGRVGDVPQVGAGFYAMERAAASATGEGEAIARFGLARRAVAAVAEGADPATAARQTIDRFAARTGGTAGVIVLDGSGATGRAHNARAMQTARRGEQ